MPLLLQQRLRPILLGAPVALLGSVAWLGWSGREAPWSQARADEPVGLRLSTAGAEGRAGGAVDVSVADRVRTGVRGGAAGAPTILDAARPERRGAAAGNDPAGGQSGTPRTPDPAATAAAVAAGPGFDATEFAGLSPRHQDMVMRLISGQAWGDQSSPEPADALVVQPEICFSSGTRPEVVRAFASARQLAQQRRKGAGVTAAATQLGSRWGRTATIDSGFSQGDPTTLTWSIVPDGTNVPGGGGGEPDSPSNVRAWLTTRYGSESVWLPLFAQVFAQWSEVSGVSYIYEPNDDGASFPGSAGALGVRGDIRIAGHAIDGNFNVLAYNYFPQGGDMVLDTSDSFFGNTSNNSRNLRTVIAHEHGHGLGLRHVCPINSTKLMEPFLGNNVNGPNHDEVYSVQRHYGDRFEPDNSSGSSENLGTLATGTTLLGDLSIDDNNDVDFVRFIPPHDGFVLTATLRPVGASYLEAGQESDGSCPSGSTFNSLTRHNLNLELRGSNGTTVLAQSDSAAAGEEETVAEFALPTGPGPFYLRVAPSTSTNGVQLYELEITMVDAGIPRILSVNDVSVNESAGSATVSIASTPAALEAIAIPWETAGGTATTAADFPASTGTAVIPAGANSVNISVPIVNDTLDEDAETFSINLTEPPNATLDEATATVTILDNDPMPTLTVQPATAGEASGQPIAFSVTLSAPSGRGVSVDWATGSATSTPTPATPDADYAAVTGTLTLAAGTISGLIGPVTVIDDAFAEADETFDLSLTNPVNVTIGTPAATARIDDDDAPATLGQTGSFAPPDPEGHPVIAWAGIVGRRYRIEFSTDLVTWAPLPGESTVTATQSSLTFTDVAAGSAERRYYRVIDLPQ